MFDEELLARLDATAEARKEGRSAVLRRAVEDYLKRRRRFVVGEMYRKAYGDELGSEDALGGEFPGWEDEGAWPSR